MICNICEKQIQGSQKQCPNCLKLLQIFDDIPGFENVSRSSRILVVKKARDIYAVASLTKQIVPNGGGDK